MPADASREGKTTNHTVEPEEIVDALAAGEFDKATNYFDDTPTKALPAASLKDTWNALEPQVGKFETRRSISTEPRIDKAETRVRRQVAPFIHRQCGQELLGIEDLLLRFVRFVDHRDINSHGTT